MLVSRPFVRSRAWLGSRLGFARGRTSGSAALVSVELSLAGAGVGLRPRACLPGQVIVIEDFRCGLGSGIFPNLPGIVAQRRIGGRGLRGRRSLILGAGWNAGHDAETVRIQLHCMRYVS